MAVETARNIVPPEQTLRLSSDIQLLGTLCGVLQQQRGKKPFFLDGRSAAKALGKPHETVASWLRALCQLGVIKRVSKGTSGMASRYLYLEQDRKQRPVTLAVRSPASDGNVISGANQPERNYDKAKDPT
jgi:hypothetical protein